MYIKFPISFLLDFLVSSDLLSFYFISNRFWNSENSSLVCVSFMLLLLRENVWSTRLEYQGTCNYYNLNYNVYQYYTDFLINFI